MMQMRMSIEEYVDELECPNCDNKVKSGYYHNDANLFICRVCVTNVSRKLKIPNTQWKLIDTQKINEWKLGDKDSDPRTSWMPSLINTKFMIEAFTRTKSSKKKKKSQSKAKKKKSRRVDHAAPPPVPKTVPEMIHEDLLLLKKEMKEQREIIMNIHNVVMKITKQLTQQQK